jgi:hypothetical protein
MHTSSVHPFQNHKAIYEKVERLVNDQRTTDEIKEELLKQEDIPEQELHLIIKYLKTLKHDKAHKMGRLLILVGAIFLLAGFVFTFFNIYKNQSVHFAMYGLTTAGLIILFMGLYYIFN